MANTIWETIETKGSQVVDQVKALIAEGNVRRIRIKQKDRVVAEFPLMMGVAGLVLAPVFAAIATISALVTDCTIEVERDVPDDAKDKDQTPPA